MSLVDRTVVGNLKAGLSEALNSRSYEEGYRIGMRYLQAAVAVLEQVEHSTKDFSFEVKVVKNEQVSNS